eukprot:CAMPEP_0196680130 /NCGR_PEP_ID=MMETSP1090-20130531/7582_1 /TAXON_ID=37098 /ORGANISM="Isochrysis sp, Strain CCMP1244" /LENGTH=106 /DNA_ID=CAMNT_0042018417 /DNA_START=202 /DNA_END=522 /DNA_ORIENTATION=-
MSARRSREGGRATPTPAPHRGTPLSPQSSPLCRTAACRRGSRGGRACPTPPQRSGGRAQRDRSALRAVASTFGKASQPKVRSGQVHFSAHTRWRGKGQASPSRLHV